MKLFAATVASIAFALGFAALLQGFAGLAGDGARVWMVAWEERGVVSDRDQWQAAVDRLLLARRLRPLDAGVSADLGRLMEWRSWQENPGSEGFEASRTLAGEFYREAIGRRPSWGYVWAHYAENLFLLGHTGSEFQTALRQAIALAPWEPGVQRKVAWMGMAAWELLPADLQRGVKETIARGVDLDFYRYEIIRLAVQYDWLPHLVPMMRNEGQIIALEFVLKQVRDR